MPIAAEEENFHRTADRLYLAQPTVTMQIQKLEQERGVRLFERRGRQVHLIAAGHRLLRRVRPLLAAYEESLEDLARWQQGYEERITLAVSPLVATTYLPLWIREFSRVHPEVELAVQVTESSETLPSMLEHESDVALSRLQVTHPQMECVPLYEDPIVFAVPPDEYNIDGPAAAPDDWLRDYTVLTHSHPEYWDDLLLALRRLYPAIRTVMWQ
ncbi:LysR family transcriptional regulator [Alicyclobacillus herbarius]|uniref:LysR family transcriptional regulator n=1 Tax=Alicyclobacillus herbarius TaxID=122960 RepID=UPI0030811818